jgi:hypothetical protein
VKDHVDVLECLVLAVEEVEFFYLSLDLSCVTNG